MAYGPEDFGVVIDGSYISSYDLGGMNWDEFEMEFGKETANKWKNQCNDPGEIDLYLDQVYPEELAVKAANNKTSFYYLTVSYYSHDCDLSTPALRGPYANEKERQNAIDKDMKNRNLEEDVVSVALFESCDQIKQTDSYLVLEE